VLLLWSSIVVVEVLGQGHQGALLLVVVLVELSKCSACQLLLFCHWWLGTE
jgi:hypothetical protein